MLFDEKPGRSGGNASEKAKPVMRSPEADKSARITGFVLLSLSQLSPDVKPGKTLDVNGGKPYLNWIQSIKSCYETGGSFRQRLGSV